MYQIVIISAIVAGMVIVAERLKVYLPEQRFKQVVWLAFMVYVIGNLYCTLLSRVPGSGTALQLRPFATSELLDSEVAEAGAELTGLFAWFMSNAAPYTSEILNVLLYVPMGYLLYILFPQMKRRHIILIGCLCSVATEIMQYLFKMGGCETDDVIYNTLGTMIGAWAWQMQSRRLSKRAE